MRKQLLNGDLAYWVSKVGCDFGQRGQDESSFSVPGMRHYQIGRLNPLVAEEENVEINRARPAGLIPDTAGFALNQKTEFQQLQRIKMRFYLRNGIDKPRLVCVIPGFGQIQ